MMIRMVGGWVFLLVPTHPGSPGQRAAKWLLLLLFWSSFTQFSLSGWLSSVGRTTSVFHRGIQASSASYPQWDRNEKRPECGDAMWLRTECSTAYSICGYTCGWQVKLRDPLLTRVSLSALATSIAHIIKHYTDMFTIDTRFLFIMGPLFWWLQNAGWPFVGRPASPPAPPSAAAAVSGSVVEVSDYHHVSSSQRAGADVGWINHGSRSVRHITWSTLVYVVIGVLTHQVCTFYTSWHCYLAASVVEYIPSISWLDAMYTHKHTQPSTAEPPGWAGARRELLEFMVQGRLTEADTPTIRLGATPSGLTSAHLHHPPVLRNATKLYRVWH